MRTLGTVAGAMMLLSMFCVSGAVQATAGYKPSGCVDTTTPYKAERFVTVAPDVKLEVLDWAVQARRWCC